MKNLEINLVVFVLLGFFLTSCKAYRNLENITPKVPKEIQAGHFDKNELKKLIPGEKISVSSITGFKYYMIYQNYTGDKLVGSAWKVNKEKLDIPQKTEIPFEEIDQVRVLRVSAAATAPLAALGAMGIFVGIVAISWSTGGGFGW
jgi:hypothetical protein